jgi:RNA polymerase sigma-54 factor
MGDLKLNIKLSQQLVMTPQLQQAIKLLQLSRMEMEEVVNTELSENPVLEEDVEAPVESEEKDPDQGKENSEDFDWSNYIDSFNSNSSTPPSTRGTVAFDDLPNVENIPTKVQTLTDHLLWQLQMSGMSPEEEELGKKIINSIDDDGYLSTEYDELVKDSKLEPERAEDVLLRIQEFDPVGVASRNLTECLLQQVRQLNIKDGNLITIIKNYMPDMEKKNYPAIAKKMKIPVEKVAELAKVILALEPKPGRSFSTNETQYIVPDIYVVKVGEDYVVMLNDDGIPRLKISSYYKNILAQDIEKGTKEYIQERLRSAVALIRSIQHRQKTIFRVTEAIVKRQKIFLEKGSAYLKPMVLRDIAEDINMHEATISRVTTNKFVHTPQGLFELKFFFNNPISSTGGEADVASESVRVRIKELLAGEDAMHPLSDQEIADLLKKHNIDIARRTVAKYREMMHVLPSGKRKKMF